MQQLHDLSHAIRGEIERRIDARFPDPEDWLERQLAHAREAINGLPDWRRAEFEAEVQRRCHAGDRK